MRSTWAMAVAAGRVAAAVVLLALAPGGLGWWVSSAVLGLAVVAVWRRVAMRIALSAVDIAWTLVALVTIASGSGPAGEAADTAWGTADGWRVGLVPLVGALALAWVSAAELIARRVERSRQAARLAAAAQERARLAREMHDSLSKTLDAIALGAAALPSSLDEPDRAARLAQILRDGTVDAARDARSLIEGLRTDSVEGPLPELLWAICQDWSGASGVAFELRVGELALEPEVAADLIWILREALRNVARHSGATRVEVELAEESGVAVLSVVDNGVGFGPETAKAGRFGLVGMQERARACGGSLVLSAAQRERAPGGGAPSGGAPSEGAPGGGMPGEGAPSGGRPDGGRPGGSGRGARVTVRVPVSGSEPARAEPVRRRVAVAAVAAVLCAGSVGLLVQVGEPRKGETAAEPRVTVSAVGTPSTGDSPSPTPTVAAGPSVAASPSVASRSPSKAVAQPVLEGGGAAPGCKVRYFKRNEWDNYFIVDVTITNTGSSEVDGWVLVFDFPAGQQRVSSWQASVSQSGARVTATDGTLQPRIPVGGSVTFGIQATFVGTNPVPTAYQLNGKGCAVS